MHPLRSGASGVGWSPASDSEGGRRGGDQGREPLNSQGRGGLEETTVRSDLVYSPGEINPGHTAVGCVRV